jgi:hypothetical protein
VVDKQTETRASILNGNMTSFFLRAAVYDTPGLPESKTMIDDAFLSVPVYKSGASSWIYSPIRYFPTVATNTVNFYAYSPIKDANMTTDLAISGTTGATFGYTIPADQSVINSAADLLIAAAVGKNPGNATGGTGGNAVVLDFNHALSAVTFSARNLNSTSSTLTYVIHSIKILGLDNVGTFKYPDVRTNLTTTILLTSWTPKGDENVTYIAGIPASGVALQSVGAGGAYKELLSANDKLIVLPQSAEYKTVEVTYSLKDGSGTLLHDKEARNLELPAGFNFDPGVRYDFQFSFAAATSSETPISFSVGVKPWADLAESL